MPIELSEERQREIVQAWEKLRINAMKAKQEYVKTAREARKYYTGPHNFIYEEGETIGGKPSFRATVNKVYELLRLFGPLCYAQDPTRNVEARRLGDPLLAEMISLYLNYTPGEFGLKDHAKREIDEGLLNGRGVLLTGPDTRTGYVKTVSVPSKDILVDASQDTWYSGDFIMRLRRNVPAWRAVRRFGIDTVKRLLEGVSAPRLNASFDFCSALDMDAVDDKDEQEKVELEKRAYEVPRISWVEVYSKMGIGLREKKSDSFEFLDGSDSEDNLLICYEPTAQLVLSVTPWPIPYWADSDKHSWPFSFVDPAENADAVWPISLIKPALGHQRFLDWGWSYAMGFIKAGARSILVKRIDDDKLDAAIESNEAIIVVSLPTQLPIPTDQILRALEQPKLTPELLNLLREVELLFEKCTGMNEVLYGTSDRAMRSATEAEMKASYSRMRIDDIIDKIEDWQSEAARKEAIGAFATLDGQRMAPLIGPDAAMRWDTLRAEMGDIQRLMGEYDYRIVSGSTRKRTPQAKIDTAAAMLDRMGPTRLTVGDLAGYNLIEQEFLMASGVPNPQRFLLTMAPPTPAVAGQQGGSASKAPEPPKPPEVLKVEAGEPVYANPAGGGGTNG